MLTAPASGANNALIYNGGNYCTAPHTSFLQLTNQFTLEAWVNPSNVSGVKYIISKGTDDQAQGQYGLMLLNGQVQFVAQALSGNGGFVLSSGSVAANTWSHIAGTYDGSVVRVYINGVLQGTTNATFTLGTNTDLLQIGRLGKDVNHFLKK